ncbi:RHS repeat protein [Wohlfahrtiimonas larvae]|uniref:Teneurin-like YD-shell domain-containing protein n=1 Tax=Wohlfahrtiimonas larvae TaxID=1157986 RepID=A0ABP9MPB0_9GAMM|nr:RHS repeat protein [Wohlfahrtiimonas larvae]
MEFFYALISQGELFVSPAVAKVNQDVEIVLELQGGEKPYQATTATLDGKPITLVNGAATVKSDQVGGHLVETVSIDASGNEITFSKRFIVKDEADITAPTAEITAPANSDNINVAEITTSVDIIGTAMDENFVEYTLYISPADEKDWTPIKTSTVPVVKGKLGEINPQTMANGQYDLLLIVKDAGGNQSSAGIGLMLKGEQKIGQFALSFEDLSFEAGSLPLFLTRTYDTLNQNSRLDFGFGWSATYQDVKIQTNRTPGLDWEIVKVGAGLNAKFCPRPIGQRLVTVRMPGGTMERFKVKTSPECNTWQSQMAGSFFSIDFEPMSGTTSELVATDVGELRVHNDQLIDYDTVDVVNPNEFRLTTKNGDVYYLDKSFGIRQIKDKTGNTLSFTKNGIFHSGGANILFNRDAQGRIVKAETTDGRSLSYAYDGDGNLKSVTDPKGEKTQFTYLQNMKAPHQLDEIIGADGKRLFKAEFDDKGQLVTQTDGNGFKVNLEHNTDKNEDVVIDQQGNKTIYLYDDQGNVNKVTDALGNTTTYTYDEFGNETSITDALGHTTKYEHNKWGEVTKETNALGFSTTTAYNANNEPTEFVDELGRKTVNLYTHDTMQLSGIQDAMGNTTKIGYSFSGNLGAITDPMGNSTSFGYQKINGKELKTSETDAAGNVTRFKYDQYGNEIERSYDVVQNGTKKTLTTKQSFDVKGNLLSSTDELGNTQRYEYNSLDQMTQQTDAKGRTTTYEYDGNGNQIKVTDPWGRVAETVYDAKGQVTKVCDDGACSETQFDALGRETKSIDALGFANESIYDGNGQLTTSIDALGNQTKYEYDALGRQTKVINALNITVSTSDYDAVGNLIQQTDANGRSVTNVYDDNNRLIEQKNALNQVTKHDYDKAGRKIATESPNGAKKQFKYNSISQLYQVLDGLNQSTLYTYDSQGKLLTQTDANKQTTRFAYNDLGQRVSRALPEGQVESSSYNTQGDLLSTKNFKGETTTFKYNGKEQLEGITYPDKRTITYSYNAKGDLTETKDSQSGSLTYQRDDLGQTLKVTTPTGELGYTWNGNGQKLSQSINQLGSYQYSYDALGRIVAVEATDAHNINLLAVLGISNLILFES